MKYLYFIVLIIGTTYLVGWCGWSKWTYLFMILLFNLAEGGAIIKIKSTKK